MAYKSKLRADIHSLDEAGTNRDHTIFHNYYSELLYSKKVSWFSQMKLFLYPISYNPYYFTRHKYCNCSFLIIACILCYPES